VRREWLSLVAASACDRSNLLFISADQGVTLHPSPLSGEVTPEHLDYFAALGRLAAVALYHGETLPLRLTAAFCSRLLGHPMALDDLKSIDPTLHKNQVVYVQKHGPGGLGLTWEDTADPTGVFRPGTMTPLVPGGASKEVTPQDVDQYLRALVAHRVVGSVRDQTAAFAAGFGAVVPPQLRTRMKGMLRGGGPLGAYRGRRRHRAGRLARTRRVR